MTPRSSIRPTRSCGSTPRRSAAPTCTSSKATCPRRPRDGSRPRGRGNGAGGWSCVTTVAPGDRVLMSCVSSCGRCRFCKEGRYGQCLGGGGWIFGHLINGLQAEYARVPFADNSVYKVPAQLTDEQVLFLADILPTSFEVGVLNGMVSPGRHRRDRRCRADRPGGDPDGQAVHARADRRDRPRRQPSGERAADSAPTRPSTTAARTPLRR